MFYGNTAYLKIKNNNKNMGTRVDIEEILADPYFRQRLKLLKKSARMTRNMSVEEMLTKGLHLIAFAHANHFKFVDE